MLHRNGCVCVAVHLPTGVCASFQGCLCVMRDTLCVLVWKHAGLLFVLWGPLDCAPSESVSQSACRQILVSKRRSSSISTCEMRGTCQVEVKQTPCDEGGWVALPGLLLGC